MTKTILLLDDDRGILRALSDYLRSQGYEALQANTPKQAEAFVESHQVRCAIVDLFLEGNRGDELSNNFIRDFLTDIPYIRLTSAPQLVPEEFSGHAVMHKRTFLDNPSLIINLIIEMLATERD